MTTIRSNFLFRSFQKLTIFFFIVYILNIGASSKLFADENDGNAEKDNPNYSSNACYEPWEAHPPKDRDIPISAIIAGGLLFIYTVFGDNNPDDPDSKGGVDPTDPASAFKWALEHGKISIIGTPGGAYGELTEVIEKMGIGSLDNPDHAINPSGDISDYNGWQHGITISDGELEKIKNMIENIMSGIPGESKSGFIDAEGEFIGLDGTPTGSGGSGGGGKGDGDGDSHTDQLGATFGFAEGAGDYGTVIHPQANPGRN